MPMAARDGTPVMLDDFLAAPPPLADAILRAVTTGVDA
jgi:hypothetical protein